MMCVRSKCDLITHFVVDSFTSFSELFKSFRLIGLLEIFAVKQQIITHKVKKYFIFFKRLQNQTELFSKIVFDYGRVL